MKICPLVFSLIYAVGLAALPATHAQILTAATFNPDAADSRVDTNGPGGTTEIVDQDDYAARIGEYFSPGGACYVVPFLLPTFSAGQQFTAATLQFELYGQSGSAATGLVNADLYGLGVRTSSAPLTSDYYQGTNDTANTLLQANFLTPANTPVSEITTSTAGSNALAAFLNAVDPNGVNAGKYVFFRVSYDANPIPNGDDSYTLLTENAGGSTEKPILTLTTGPAAVPEPSTVLIMGLCGVSLAVFRRPRK